MMDGARFVKLCKDCGIIGKGFTVTDADLIFSKVPHRHTASDAQSHATGQAQGCPQNNL